MSLLNIPPFQKSAVEMDQEFVIPRLEFRLGGYSMRKELVIRPRSSVRQPLSLNHNREPTSRSFPRSISHRKGIVTLQMGVTYQADSCKSVKTVKHKIYVGLSQFLLGHLEDSFEDPFRLANPYCNTSEETELQSLQLTLYIPFMQSNKLDHK